MELETGSAARSTGDPLGREAWRSWAGMDTRGATALEQTRPGGSPDAARVPGLIAKGDHRALLKWDGGTGAHSGQQRRQTLAGCGSPVLGEDAGAEGHADAVGAGRAPAHTGVTSLDSLRPSLPVKPFRGNVRLLWAQASPERCQGPLPGCWDVSRMGALRPRLSPPRPGRLHG